MKRFAAFFLLLLIASSAFARDAKYVFYFIGDGMGANIVNYTQMYKAAMAGKHGAEPLCFTEWPTCGVATTWSANSLITDSAASGTALSTGVKTNNTFLGVTPDGSRLESIAERARAKGMKVSIVTTVGANHATPAAFFAHQTSRNNYDQIVYDMIAADFDFYAGNDIIRSKKNVVEGLNPEQEFRKAGYTIVRSREEFKSSSTDASKIVFLPDRKHSVKCAMDRDADNTTLSDFVSSSIEFLMKDGCRKGFFIMAEGGRIDSYTHGNDAASAVREIMDMDAAVAIAYSFYLKHPKETAIIVTSDHDTGGCGIRPSFGGITNLQWQTKSQKVITSELKSMMKNHIPSWEEVKDFLAGCTGLWTKVKVQSNDEAELKKIYDATIAVSQTGNVTDEYGYNNNAVIVSNAIEILNRYSGITWSTRSHSSAYVPCYYIGPRSELFSGLMDNTKIARSLFEVMF